MPKCNQEDGLSICLKRASDAVYDEIIVKPAIRIAEELNKVDKKKKVKKRVKKSK